MIKLKINNQDIEVSEETTVLEAAQKLGIEIPTMCYMPGLDHFTSCMVCMVENEATGKLIPACSMKAVNDMRISTNSEKVMESRKTSLELLLSEHVGDCDAPCHKVCKGGINIPVMIRKIAEGKINEAATVIKESANSPSDPCGDCNGQCEKACRRKQHDGAVSIMMLIRYALDNGKTSQNSEKEPEEKLFNCNMGRIQPMEMEEFLKQASASPRIEPANNESFTADEAKKEAERCLHCDCRKRETCKLRLYATEYDAKQRHYAFADRKTFKQIRQGSGIVYEPGKCIKCGLCVRITSKHKEELGLTFIGRGFSVEVGVPFNESLKDGLKTTAMECVKACPTAALASE